MNKNHYIKTGKQRELYELAGKLADQFSSRAEEVDRQGVFPFTNFKDLKQSGYLSLTVPKQYGGEAISLYELVLIQERLAQGDASTALGAGWHLGIIMDLAERREWDEKAFDQLCDDVVQNKVLINRAATEPATGSPTRGGKPETTAKKDGDRWVLNGRKTFTTMAPGLDLAVVTASLEDDDKVCGFLVPCNAEGVKVENTWDTLGMRGTSSDDLILENVVLPAEANVETLESNPKKKSPAGWLLHIPACYLGIAVAARNYAVTFAKEYSPNSLPGPIKDVPHVREKIGEMELEIRKARSFLYATAERWDNDPETRIDMQPDLATAKYIVTNSAVKVVDVAMRLVGGRSLAKSNPLERYYRDVRAGLHNPPSDDATIGLLAKDALDE